MSGKIPSPHTGSRIITDLQQFISFVLSSSFNVDTKKKATSIFLLLVFLLSFATNIANAQSSSFKKKSERQVATPVIKVSSFETAGNAVGGLLKWKTDSEVNNLGFNIYRDEDGRRVLINQQLVTGSVLTISSKAADLASHSYEWRDHSLVKGSATYWLEAVDLNGNSTWQGPFTVQSAQENFMASETSQAVEPLAKLSKPEMLAVKKQAPPAASKSWKIAVTQEGWYSISQAELLAAGFSSSVDPRKLQVYADGRPQAIYVKGQEDGRFNSTDTLEFYGQGIDSAFSNSRIYWLVEEKTNGLRLRTIPSTAALNAGGNFPFSVERQDKTIYFSSCLNGDTDNFFGAVIVRQPLNQTLTLQHLDSSERLDATLQVSLQGVTWIDHLVEVKVNDNPVGQLEYFGQMLGEATFSVAVSFLNEGENVVTLTPLGGNSDVSLVDTIRLTYPHTYTADDDYLRLSAKGQQAVTIWGFTNDAIEVFDMSNAASVQKLSGQLVTRRSENDGSIEFGISFVASGSGQNELLAMTQNRFSRVAKIALDSPSDLRKTSQGADFVIIANKDVFPAAEELQQLRIAQGLSTNIVDIEDIYDEFSFGQKNPQAIKDFLYYAKTSWHRSVRYALFLGDASFDPKNHLGHGDFDLVPTKLMDTLFLETATDDWFADFNEDGISDLAVGRLPARNQSEADIMVAKILAYEKATPSNDVLMVSDINDVYDFEGENQNLATMLPPGLNVTFVMRSQMSDSQARTAIIDNFNRGAKLVNYAGHGTVNLWRGNLFSNADARNLQNMEGLPMVVTMNCLNGFFQDPVTEGLSESLLKAPQGGAVAAWGSSASTFADVQSPVNQEFYRLVFMNPTAGITIGEAAIRAKAMTEDLDVRRSWILFGDPTMRLK
jgi:hypothetical protein